MTKKKLFESATQVLLPALTFTGFLLTSLKYPGQGLAVNLVAQVFWIYTGWVAWRRAGQIGLFVTTLLITLVILYGVLNYFVFT